MTLCFLRSVCSRSIRSFRSASRVEIDLNRSSTPASSAHKPRGRVTTSSPSPVREEHSPRRIPSTSTPQPCVSSAWSSCSLESLPRLPPLDLVTRVGKLAIAPMAISPLCFFLTPSPNSPSRSAGEGGSSPTHPVLDVHCSDLRRVSTRLVESMDELAALPNAVLEGEVEWRTNESDGRRWSDRGDENLGVGGCSSARRVRVETAPAASPSAPSAGRFQGR